MSYLLNSRMAHNYCWWLNGCVYNCRAESHCMWMDKNSCRPSETGTLIKHTVKYKYTIFNLCCPDHITDVFVHPYCLRVPESLQYKFVSIWSSTKNCFAIVGSARFESSFLLSPRPTNVNTVQVMPIWGILQGDQHYLELVVVQPYSQPWTTLLPLIY